MAILLFSFCALCWVAWRFFLVPVRVGQGASLETVCGSTEKVRRDWLVWWPKRVQGPSRLRYFAHWSVLLALPICVLAVVGVLALSSNIAPDPVQAQEMYRQQHIKLALNPERLAPPPALPPSLFVSAERPGLESADREWGRLHPEFMQVALQLLARSQARGYSFVLLEGYRSPERQEKLAAMGSHVTNAKAFQSKHQYGLAVDLAPIFQGKLVISERDPQAIRAYEVLGEEAEKLGLVWGGRWWFKDYGHIEAPGSIQANLEMGKR